MQQGKLVPIDIVGTVCGQFSILGRRFRSFSRVYAFIYDLVLSKQNTILPAHPVLTSGKITCASPFEPSCQNQPSLWIKMLFF